MKKKVLSIFLALMLCLSLLPTAALAEEAGTAGAGDTLAAEQGEGNTVTEQDEDSTVTEQDEDSTGTGQGEGDVLSEQSVSAAAFSSAAETHSHANNTVFARKLSQSEGTLQIDGETWEKDESGGAYVLPAGDYYLETNLTLNAGITVSETVTLCLNGNRIEFKGDHTYITVHGTFTLTDCKGTGTITHGNKDDGSKYPGSGVSVAFGTFHMEGGSITGNSATNGGGVYVFYGTFNMSGGSITGNTATGDGNTPSTGGGVFVSEDSTFSMSGGSITGNTATSYGGGVYVHDTFMVSGGVKISGNNKSDGSNSNVYLSDGKTISVTGALGGAEIGVTTAKAPAGSPITIAEGGGNYAVTEVDAKVFSADDLGKYSTKFVENKKVQLSTGETQMVHPVCGMECTHMDSEGNPEHPVVTWKPWSEKGTLPHTGNYYLTVDVTLTKTWSFTKVDGVALDLNGKTVSITTSDKTIESCRDVTLTDCRGGGKITHGSQKGLGVHVYGGTFDMYGGSITGNSSSSGGGGVWIQSGTFNLYDGSISGNETDRGGGVYMKDGTFNMYGGSISGNTAGTYGGGVYVGDGTFKVSGGVKISGNKNSDGSNSNVYLSDGKTITVTGALGGAKIGVTTEKTPESSAPVTIAKGDTYTLTETDRDCFTPDKGSEYQVNLSNNTLVLAVPPHVHSWTYTASGDTITAKCTVKGCTLDGAIGGSYTIVKPPHEVYGDGKKVDATITVAAAAGVTLPDAGSIIYAKGGTALDAAPVDAGEYTASITMGSATATVTFKIAKADAPDAPPSGLTGYVGKALSTVVLPDGWTWVDGTTVMNTAGDAVEFRANYGGDNNHNPANNVAVSVKVVETSGGGSTGGNTGGGTGGNTGGGTGGNTGGNTGGGSTGGGSGHRVSTSAPAAPTKLPTLLLGSRSSDVKTLQEMLNAKGYNAGSVDGIFGRNTRAAVIAFQNANGLAADGIVGKLTWAKLYDTTAALPAASTATGTQPMVYRGSRGDAVRKLQELLNKKGFDCGAVDGIFGSKTYAAVMAFQKANGLSADGIAGPLTWGKLG